MNKLIPLTMISLVEKQKMDTKKSVCDYRKGEWDAFKVYCIDKSGKMGCMSADSFEDVIKDWETLTHHEKIACVNFVKSMNEKYGKYHKYNKMLKLYAKFEV